MHIFGASGHAKVVIESLLSTDNTIDGIFDDNELIESILGIRVLGVLKQEHYNSISEIIVAIGDNRIREKIVQTLPFQFGNAIHKTATISPYAKLGTGIAIMANTVVNADTVVGNHVVINTSASIDHDCVIGDFVHIAPNSTICGGINIGKGSLVGAGAVITPNIKVGAGVTIGAGAVITKDIPDNSTIIRYNKKIKNE